MRDYNAKDLKKITEKYNLWCFGKLTDRKICDTKLTNLRYSQVRFCHHHGCDFSRSDFSHSNLSYSDFTKCSFEDSLLVDCDISECDITDVNLRGADLKGSDLDYSSLPLSPGGLDVHIDDRLATQILYHLVRNVLFSKNTSDILKSLLGTDKIISQANKFHHVDETGEIALKQRESKEC